MLVHDEWFLTPQRIAVHRPTATAVLADLHLGYNEARRRDGEAVPAADLPFILAPLKSVIATQSIRKVVIAGDLFEAGFVTGLAADLVRWMNDAGVELAAVAPGNHDRGLVPGGHGLPIHPNGFLVGRWRVVHGDGRLPDGPVIHGHEHPCVRWSNRLPARVISSRMSGSCCRRTPRTPPASTSFNCSEMAEIPLRRRSRRPACWISEN